MKPSVWINTGSCSLRHILYACVIADTGLSGAYDEKILYRTD